MCLSPKRGGRERFRLKLSEPICLFLQQYLDLEKGMYDDLNFHGHLNV